MKLKYRGEVNEEIYTIKFSHRYKKMESFDLSKPFTLLEIFLDDVDDLHAVFLIYDTQHERGNYNLPDGQVMVLLLEQDNKLMTTIRSHTPSKLSFYSDLIGKQVMCKVM